MALKIIYGDILEQNVDVYAISLFSGGEPATKFGKRFYGEAGYEKMKEAVRRSPNRSVIVTSGFDLKARHVIHVRTPSWYGGTCGEQRKLARCYWRAIDAACKLGAKSIAFPLLGAGLNRFPAETARSIAEDTIGGHLKAKSLQLDVYLVILPEYRTERTNREKISSFGALDPFPEYNRILAEKLNNSGMDGEAFCAKLVYDYLNRIENDSEIAETAGFDSSIISRFRTSRGNSSLKAYTPHKRRVIALAVAMKLSDYERFEFIQCSLKSASQRSFRTQRYPSCELDNHIEMILRSGITEFSRVNDELCKINPEFALNAPVKGNSSK